MKVFVIAPVRTTSTRLRGKIFWPLAGKSMLQNFIERIQRAKSIDGIAIACPPRDLHEFTEFTKDWGITVVAPDVEEWDLIGRLYVAGKMVRADLIIRICADNPCVEPEEIDSLVLHSQFLESPCRELRMNSEHLNLEFDGFGGELYTLEMLEWMDRVIKDPFYREHPHQIWGELRAYSYCGKMYPRGFRLEVNTEEEYLKLKDIYDHFGHNRFSVMEVMEYLSEKDLAERPLSVGI